ncbi:hypothetical protein JCM33374_g5786 [Metschnikowia sp. JCM 33374]|nr:hypothetical protein JCM33374_g5786 [Metschnikowia sp. JCM 33374]
MAIPNHSKAEQKEYAKIRHRGSTSSTLSSLPTEPNDTPAINSGADSGTGLGTALGEDQTRSRSSTTSVFLDFIDDEPRQEADGQKPKQRLSSLYRLLVLELNLPGSASTKMSSPGNSNEIDKAQEQLTNMVKVPFYLEKFIFFGLLVCSNAFLTLFTLVPLKIAIVCYAALRDYLYSPQWNLSILIRKLHFVKRDLITLLLIISSVALLSTPLLEVSRLYHDIRGQAHIKLYVMFGVLEVTDKLLSSITQEVFTMLVGLPLTNMTPRKFGKLLFCSLVALAFFACHSYALIYQSVALHVAANSYSNALLALLLSNQFSELKSAVFKKFEREGLFQVTMSDLTERFQLSIMLFVISLRNLSQLSSTELGLIPDSWKSWNKWFGAIFGPSVVVLGSEIMVDWVKHCYINKFNLIRPRIYENFLYVLSSDFKEVFTSNSKLSTSHEVSDYIILTKRIGLPIISLTICFLRMALKDLRLFFLPASAQLSSVLSSAVLIILAFVVLLVTRLLLSLWLLKWARYIRHSHETYQQHLKSKAGPAPVSKPNDLPIDILPAREEQKSVSMDEDRTDPQNYTNNSPLESDLILQFSSTLRDTDIGSAFSEVLVEDCYNDDQVASPAESEIEYSFLPGIPNTESSSINPTTRSYLYDFGEDVPPTLEEKRNAQLIKKKIKPTNTHEDFGIESLHKVHRYEMSSKKIW